MKGFENKDHEREFWAALRKRTLPLKFAYAGDAAYTHSRLANQSTYKEVAGATAIETNTIVNCFPKEALPPQLCDVGPGNGVHSGAFLRQLSDLGYRIDRYLGLDFSVTLLNIGMEYLKKLFPYLKVEYGVWDFEKGPTRAISDWRTDGAALVTLTGHTLGNPENPLQVIRHHYASCNPGDIFLLGVALVYDCDPEVFLQKYRNDIFRAAALEPMKMAGIDVDKGEFRLSFSRSSNAILAEFTFGEETTLRYERDELTFKCGETIHCFMSRRFSDSNVRTMLEDSGWVLKTVSYDSEKTHGVYLSVREETR